MSCKHLILDLDSTLIHSIFEDAEIDSVINDPRFGEIKHRIKIHHLVDSNDYDKKGNGRCNRVMVILRPHLEEFLHFIRNNIDRISIWSAGHFRYVRAIEYMLFPTNSKDTRNYPDLVFTREHCVFGETSVLKDFGSVGLDLENTIILDDREDTFSNNPQNGIHIPIYAPRGSYESIIQDDVALLSVINWFKTSGVLTCSDVRSINKQGIF